MKHLLILSLIIISVLYSSCRNKRLKTNEKELAREIFLQEKEKSELEKTAHKEQFSDTLKGLSGDFRYKENRSVDLAHPPKMIDIANNLDHVKEIKLSEVASDIRYIRIQQPPDSVFNKKVNFNYYLTDNYIIAAHLYGIIQYSRDGRYINTIVKNVYTGMDVFLNSSGSYGIMSYSGRTFIGSLGPEFKSAGDKLQYSYLNNIASQEYLMEYDCSEVHVGQPIEYDPEDPVKIIGQGKVKVDLNQGKINPAEPIKTQEGMWKASPGYVEQAYLMHWINDRTYSKKLKGNDMLGIFNKHGDTLTIFTQHEKLVNYTKSIQRSPDSGVQYEFNNKLMFRNPYNDTVFQIIPPNRLLPVYAINFGKYKVTRQQGVDPSFNLADKIMLENITETEKYIYLVFTKDNYDCIANRNSKKVKIYHALFSKLDHQVFIIKGDPFDYSTEILGNDIADGFPAWPSSHNLSQYGDLMISIQGKQLKDRVIS